MTLRQETIKALLKFKRVHEHPAMRKLMETIAGVSAISAIPDDKLDALLQAARLGAANLPAQGLFVGDIDSEQSIRAIWANWNRVKLPLKGS